MFKKILLGFGLVLFVGLGVVAFLMYQSSTPLSADQGQAHLEKYFEGMEKGTGNKAFSGVQVRVYSKAKGLDLAKSYGSGSRLEGLGVDTPFHIASVGKLMTAVMVYQIMEEQGLSLDQPIKDLLPEGTLDRLFVIDGDDFQGQVTLKHLLSHTSGVADYFGGPVTQGKTMTELLEEAPDKLWSPEDLVNFSKENQVAVFKPGEGYLYSDTGYVLLGLFVEAVTDKSFEENLRNRLLDPLAMEDTYMALRQEPISGVARPIADIWLDALEVGGTNSLSVDWAGGGLVSTLEDLLRFSQALHQGNLLSEPSYRSLFSDENQFEQGIYTGTGGMTIHFEKFFPLLSFPEINGHIGVTATHLFYDLESETHIVMNFGSTSKMTDSFMALIEIMSTLQRIQ